jgi:acyl carrier protein
MNKEEALQIVIEAVKGYIDDENANINPETILLGNNAVVDSIGLVNLIVDIESALSDKNFEITLTSEDAMSRRKSPFRSVETLSDYIIELTQA